MKAYIYARISSIQQKQGVGLDRQTQDALLYCKAHNLVVHDIQQDIASAYHARHLEGKLGAFLQAIKDNVIEVPSALVVESLDRLGRDHELKALARFIDIVQHGIEIHEMSTGVVYNREDTHLLHLAVAVMSRAHNESKVKASRIKDAQARKHEDAKSGKIVSRNIPAWIDIVHGEFKLNEHERTVKLIYDLYLEGYAYKAISRKLQELKVPYPPAKIQKQRLNDQWAAARVCTILSSPAVYGQYTPKNKDPIDNYYPPVVDIATYQKVQAIKKSRAFKATKITDLLSLTSTITKCKHCGHSYVASSRTWTNAKGTETKISMKCNGRLMGGTCKGKSVPMEALEKAVMDMLPDVDISKLNRTKMRTLDNVKANLERTLEQQQNIMELVLTGSKMAVDKYKELEQKAEDLKVQIQQLEARIVPDTLQSLTVEALDPLNCTIRKKVNTALALMQVRVVLDCLTANNASIDVYISDNHIGKSTFKWSKKKRIDARS